MNAHLKLQLIIIKDIVHFQKYVTWNFSVLLQRIFHYFE